MFNRSVKYIYILAFLVAIPLISLAAQPDYASVQIPAAEDSYVAEDEPGWKAGLEDYLIIGFSKYFSQHNCDFVPGAGYYKKGIVCTQEYRVEDRRNILVHFNLSQIPPGSEVIDAILQLHIYSPASDLPVVIYGLKECFEEDGVTWISRNASRTWSESGGTHELSVLDRGPLGKFQRNAGFYRFNVTDYYKRVLKGEIENCGILIGPDPMISSGSKEVKVDTCDMGGECQAIYRNGFKKYIIEERNSYYVKFYSKEWAKENKPEYTPLLMIKFKKPSIYLIPRELGPLVLSPSEKTSFTLSLKGSFLGNVTLNPELEGGEGIDVKLEGFEGMGSTFKVIVSSSEDAKPGVYKLNLVPIASGYDPSYLNITGVSVSIKIRKITRPLKDYFLMMPDHTELDVRQGGEASLKLSLVPRGKFWSKVHLSSVSPDWMEVSFDPEEGVPSFASTVKVKTDKNSPIGIQKLVLVAEGGGLSRNLTITVRVMEAQHIPVNQTETTSSEHRETATEVKTGTTPTTSLTTMTNTTTSRKIEGGFNPALVSIPLLIIIILAALLYLRRHRSS